LINHQLIKRCLKEDRLAQQELYEILFNKMYATCRRYTRNDEDAKEVHNSAMLKVFKNLAQYNQSGPFEAWVHRIMVNTAINFNKSKSQYNEQVSFNLDYITIPVENDAWNNMGVEEIFQAIRDLAPATQLVFNMFVLDGFSHNEISKQLKIGVNTSKWHVFHAKQELRKIIKKKQNNPSVLYG
jgi:RNA polymerase sigma factor (sigma-70 family)